MRAFYIEPITAEILAKKLTHELGEQVIHYERISALHNKHPYKVKNELYKKYLEHAEQIINDVGGFVRDYLPGFPSYQRTNFDYVRMHQKELLEEYGLLMRVRAETASGEKELQLCFDLPSFVSTAKMFLRMKWQYVCLYNHLESRISFVIGSPGNPKTEEQLVSEAMEEFWHLALFPYLLEKLNKHLQGAIIAPSDYEVSKGLLMEGELVSKAFALASFKEFYRKKGYRALQHQSGEQERVMLDKIEHSGIRRALREFSKSKDL
jgi:hypothetical protein